MRQRDNDQVSNQLHMHIFVNRWEGYKVETWLNKCEIREAITKRPLKTQPKKADWPTTQHPSYLQRFDGVQLIRGDGTRGDKKIVYINDPYNGKVSDSSMQKLRGHTEFELPYYDTNFERHQKVLACLTTIVPIFQYSVVFVGVHYFVRGVGWEY